MEELIKRLERVIQTGAPDKDGQHPIGAETVLEVVKELSELGTNLAEVGTDCSEFPNNSDTISRQAAIEALDKRFDKIPMEQTTEILKLRKDLRGLPSIQSEQKRGRWIYGEDEYGIDGYHCDKCGFFVPWDYTHKFINYIEDYNFCPSCGADMRGEQDG